MRLILHGALVLHEDIHGLQDQGEQGEPPVPSRRVSWWDGVVDRGQGKGQEQDRYGDDVELVFLIDQVTIGAELFLPHQAR